MADESLTKRKWWHATLYVYDLENVLLDTFTSINAEGPAINNERSILYAFPTSTSVVDCTDRVQIPVASYETTNAAGYFVFRPTVVDLEELFIDVASYAEANSTENKRIFNFERTAAYDPLDYDCAAVTPTAHDTRVYEEIENTLSSNIHRFPEINYFTSIGCCSLGVALPQTDIDVAPTTGNGTKAYYLLEDNDRYRIYSIDFLYDTEYLVSHGELTFTSLPIGLELSDITWYLSDLYCITNQGFYRLLLGNDTDLDVRIADKINIDWNNIAPFNDAQISSAAFSAGIKSCEYNYLDNKLYVILHPSINSTNTPYICIFTVDNFNTFSLTAAYPIVGTNCATPASEATPKIFGIRQDYINVKRIYTVYEDEVAFINGATGELTKLTSSSTAANINSLYIAASSNPAVEIWRATDTNNQCYQINATSTSFDDFNVLSTTNFFLPNEGTIIGVAGTRSGDNLRKSEFPFQTNAPHHVFLVDTSINMAGEKFSKTKNAIINFLDNYVRYNEKVTLYFYNNTFIKYTKEIRTFLDISEAKSFVATYFNLNNINANICAALQDAANDFADIQSFYIISSGINSNCNDLADKIATFKTNEQLQFITIADLSTTKSLEGIAQQNNDVYINWQ